MEGLGFRQAACLATLFSCDHNVTEVIAVIFRTIFLPSCRSLSNHLSHWRLLCCSYVLSVGPSFVKFSCCLAEPFDGGLCVADLSFARWQHGRQVKCPEGRGSSM